jgi:hypothetical protein
VTASISGLGYWASLLVVVVGIALMLAGLVLAVFLLRAVFDFIAPYLGPPPAWISELWERFKIAIVLLAIVAFATAVVVFARHDARTARKRAETYARSQGWEFSAHDDELQARISDVVPDMYVHAYHVRISSPPGIRSARS